MAHIGTDRMCRGVACVGILSLLSLIGRYFQLFETELYLVLQLNHVTLEFLQVQILVALQVHVVSIWAIPFVGTIRKIY